jgi:hypothetical protein|tara:strand:+ start:3598 stop:3930 length:333 start_codon:yes stop_codon:yes gene_type:complete
LEFIEDTARLTCICKSDKMVTPLTIRKSRDGFIFFEVITEKGAVPEELKGKFSNMPSAREAVAQYFRTMPETVAARRASFNKDFDERKKVKNAAKSEPEDDQHLHQGLDN